MDGAKSFSKNNKAPRLAFRRHHPHCFLDVRHESASSLFLENYAKIKHCGETTKLQLNYTKQIKK